MPVETPVQQLIRRGPNTFWRHYLSFNKNYSSSFLSKGFHCTINIKMCIVPLDTMNTV